MLTRNWRRLCHIHSWQPVGGLVILLLLANLVLDALWNDYTQASQQLDRAETELAVMRMQVERLPEIETMAKRVSAKYGEIQSRLIPSNVGIAADKKFEEILLNWYASKGIPHTSVREVQKREEGSLVYYRTSLDATLRIDQLVELLESIPVVPVSIRMVEAVITGNDENTPNGLRTLISWEGLSVPANGRETTGYTNKSSSTDPSVNEEKRK